MTFVHAHTDDERTRRIIGCAIQVHQELGPGLLEAPYQAALCIALLTEGIPFEREKAFPIMFRGARIADYRPDLVVNNEVVVEIKSVERFDPVFMSQMLTYLRITGLNVGLIINFNRPRLLDGVKRISLWPLCALRPVRDPRSLRWSILLKNVSVCVSVTSVHSVARP